MSKLIHGLMFAACAAFAIHGSAFAQVREVTQQPTSQPTTLSLPSTLWDAFAISRSGKVLRARLVNRMT
jgi:acyl CoA:acetate/3-ketoacid CoA transferase